jgi:hypothetical protein
MRALRTVTGRSFGGFFRIPLFNQEPFERPPNLLRKRDPVTCFEPQHVKQELPRASYADEDVEWMFQKVAAEQAWQP